MKKILIILLTALSIIGFLASPIMNVRYVNIYGNNALTTSAIMNTIPEPTHILSYSRRRAVDSILSTHPLAYRVSLTRDFFRREININIIERIVIAYVMFSENQYLHIDIEGRVLTTSTYIGPELPIVSGLYFSSFSLGETLQIEKDNLYILATLSTLLTTYNVNSMFVEIEDVSNIRMRYGNIFINLGNAQNLDEKIRVFIATLPYVSQFRNIGGTLHIYDINSQWRFEF